MTSKSYRPEFTSSRLTQNKNLKSTRGNELLNGPRSVGWLVSMASHSSGLAHEAVFKDRHATLGADIRAAVPLPREAHFFQASRRSQELTVNKAGPKSDHLRQILVVCSTVRHLMHNDLAIVPRRRNFSNRQGFLRPGEEPHLVAKSPHHIESLFIVMLLSRGHWLLFYFRLPEKSDLGEDDLGYRQGEGSSVLSLASTLTCHHQYLESMFFSFA